MTTNHAGKARAFTDLHRQKEILVLPNAWDAASARVFELAGARAIAITSSGLAATFGYPDGEQINRGLLILMVGRIIKTVDIPVSVDLEAGYGATLDEVCETVRAVIKAGAVGINIEDEVREPAVLVNKIRAIRELAQSMEVPLFINARTDVYLRGQGDAAAQFDDAVRRLRVYETAGVDGLFAPGLKDAPTITRLLREIRLPLNILAGPDVPPAKELERLGVSRVSVGSGPMRATMSLTRRIADELLHEGTYSAFLTDTISHAGVNEMFTRRRVADSSG